jgi:hypothetical protein
MISNVIQFVRKIFIVRPGDGGQAARDAYEAMGAGHKVAIKDENGRIYTNPFDYFKRED